DANNMRNAQAGPPPGSGGGGGMMGMMGGGAGGGGARPGGGGPGGGGGFGAGPTAQTPATKLATKPDPPTHQPPAITLTEEQRTKLREQLQGLDEADKLEEEDAKKRLDAILEIVKGDKETLQAAGYRWPGERGFGPPPSDAPNPFKDEASGQHLKG